MTWEQNARVIVMITHLFENGKPKCDLYWPDAGSDTYGEVVVTLTREDVLSNYTLRTFSLRKAESAKEAAAKNNKVRRIIGWTESSFSCGCMKRVAEGVFLFLLQGGGGRADGVPVPLHRVARPRSPAARDAPRHLREELLQRQPSRLGPDHRSLQVQ